MKLDEYIEQTLIDISKGVSEAKKKALVGIAPGYVDGEKVFSAQLIKFEIVVTVEKEGSGGIQVLTFGDLKGKLNIEHTNKLTFEVPVYFQAPPVSGIGNK